MEVGKKDMNHSDNAKQIETAEHIYEPLTQYKRVFKDSHHTNVVNYFEDLVQRSAILEEENRAKVKEIKTCEVEIHNLQKKISKYRSFATILIILSIVLCIIGIYTVMNHSNEMGQFENIGIVLACIVLIGVSFFLIFKSLKPKIKKADTHRKELEATRKSLVEEAWRQLAPLNALFQEGISTKLFHQTIPLIMFDKMFDSKRLDYLVQKFGLFSGNDFNRSTLFVQSGEIQGNPFYISRDLVHRLGTKTYVGTKVIHWTTTRTVNGKRQVVHHSQTLTASVDKPCPYYSEQPYLVYGNEAAPNLSFHRQETDVENLTDKQIEKKVSKDIKKLNKQAEKQIKSGGNYTVLGNSEFEVLFGAINRDNEVQFRLLFTPLAQKQLLELMKEKEYGFGDEFDFVKENKINYIFPKQLQNFNISVSPSYYYGYDIDEVRNRFIKYNDDYFRSIYFSFAPLLSIPLYQQQKPQEYIYKDLYDSYVSFYEHERVVNQMNAKEFIHPLSQTRNILKTSVVKSGNHCDVVRVTAHGYETIKRMDFITKLGGDGRMHSIPVEWIEYIPVSQETDVEINVVEEAKQESYQDRFRSLIERLKDKKVSKEEVFQMSSFLAYIVKKNTK